MKTERTPNLKIMCVVFFVEMLGSCSFAETLYVDSRDGNDINPGTKEKPFRTIFRAAQLVNGSSEKGPAVIKIAPGVYNLDKTVVFENTRPFTKVNRLMIEAANTPDDPDWLPKFMPVVISTEPSSKTDYENYQYSVEKFTIGFKMEISHVTIQGLKFLGNPAEQTWHYPIWREGDDLTDLLITQCLFVGGTHTTPYVAPICAKGHEIVVEHCIFYNCHTPLIFWDAKGGISRGCAVRYCIIDGADIAAVWTTQTSEDFDFHHNIVTRSNYFWMRSRDNRRKYRLKDCVITDYKFYSGYGNAFELFGQTSSEINYDEVNVIKQGIVRLHQTDEKFDVGKLLRKERSRDYLHPVPATAGYDLGAGLFRKKQK